MAQRPASLPPQLAALLPALDALVSAAERMPQGSLAPEQLRGLAWQLRQPVRDKMFGLYVIVDTEVTGGHEPIEIARAALKGGARMIQLRAKNADKGDVLALARNVQKLCSEHDAVYIINDHADLARGIDADGVHVGQHDLPVDAVRKVLSPAQVVGRSNNTYEQALESEASGVDYVAVGTIYPTGSKGNTHPAGIPTLKRVKAAVRCPIVAIGGINASNVAEVVRAGADAVCVISAVSLAKDPEAAARDLVLRIRAAGGKA